MHSVLNDLKSGLQRWPHTEGFSSGKHQSSARTGVAACCVYDLLYSLNALMRQHPVSWGYGVVSPSLWESWGRTCVQRCCSHVGVPAFDVYVSACTWCPASCSCLASITYASNRPYSQSFYACCHNGSLFSLARSLSCFIYTCFWTTKKGR